MPEMRKHRRYPVAVPATFAWRNGEGAQFDGSGTTRDISTAGAYIFTRTTPGISVMVQAEVQLDRLLNTPNVAPKMRMEFVGHVVRVDTELAETGFALVSHTAVVFDPPSDVRQME